MFNRIYLIGILLLSFAIPAFELRVPVPDPDSLSARLIDAVTIYPSSVARLQNEQGVNSESTLTIIFLTVSMVVALYTIRRVLEVIVLIKKNEAARYKGYNIIEIPENYPSFSFFNYIFINSEKDSQEYNEQVLKHEMAHARQFHSADILLIQLVKIVNWFNPFIYLLERSLKETHEYLADRSVLEQDGRTDRYKLLLLSQVFGLRPGIINFFNSSLIKNRIIMMTKKESPQYRKLRYLVLLPLIAMLTVFFNCAEDTQVIKEPAMVDVAPPPPPPPAAEKEFVFVEDEATFQGGTLVDFRNWVAQNVKYPPQAIENGISGRTTIQFTVSSDGLVRKVTPIRSSGSKLLDDEAARVVLSSPKWEPAQQGGVNVAQIFTMPVVFSLE